MAEEPDVILDKTSKRVFVPAHVGDDIRIAMRLRYKSTDPVPVYTDVDWNDVTVETTLKREDDTTDIQDGLGHDELSQGRLVLLITDTQTTEYGEGVFYGSLRLVTGDLRETKVSFKFQLTSPEDPY